MGVTETGGVAIRHRGRVLAAVLAAGLFTLPARTELSGQVTRRAFTHASHKSMACVACHTSVDARGQVRMIGPADCQLCHHRNATPQTCARCHTTAPDADRRYTAPIEMHIAGQTRARDLPFVHTKHAATACATCHSQLPSMALTPALCETCHGEHHKTDRNCEACHQQPPPTAHAKAAHLTCGGAGCHAPAFIEGDPRTRQVCLACHEQQRDHQPGERCVYCHVLPPFRTAGEADR